MSVRRHPATCSQCAASFFGHRKAAKFCSVKCSAASRAIHRTCERCGAPYLAGTSRIRYCSNECRLAINWTAMFWSQVNRADSAGCWLWLGHRNTQGYGTFTWRTDLGRKTVRTHRFAWELSVGPIPPGLHVLHRCDNPPCCNPAHLWLGTNDDNMADRDAKNRRVILRGEQHGCAVLKAESVDKIRALRLTGWTLSSLAERFGVTETTVSRICLGRAWKHRADVKEA